MTRVLDYFRPKPQPLSRALDRQTLQPNQGSSSSQMLAQPVDFDGGFRRASVESISFVESTGKSNKESVKPKKNKKQKKKSSRKYRPI